MFVFLYFHRPVPGIIYAHVINPRAVKIVMLRKPVDRLYSGFLWKRPHYSEFENETRLQYEFDLLVNYALEEWDSCMSQYNSTRTCYFKYISSPNYNPRLRLFRNLVKDIYYFMIEDVLKVVSRDRLLVIKSEDYYADRGPVVSQIFNMMNLPTLDKETMMSLVKTEKINSGDLKKEGVADKMLPKTARKLEKFYKPFNEKLVKLLKDERFYWT